MIVVITWRRVLMGLAGLALAGLLVSFSGLVSIAASSGHLPPVAWFLHWTMQNAVRTQSLGISPPPGLDLDDPALVRRASGHFDTGCAPCHGSPAEEQNPVVLKMTPAPPPLSEKVPEWRPRELFWIVKHGVKYSGMPAWPAPARDDEIWAMVAFLRALPEMDAGAYLRLAEGTAAEQPEVAADPRSGRSADDTLEACARCHGLEGRGADGGGAFPNIAGQPVAYLEATLRAFASGDRASGIMEFAAAIHSDPALDELARRYANEHPAIGSPLWSSPELLEKGRRIAQNGVPDRFVPACEACHGRPLAQRDQHIPSLDGQHAWYLETQLELFKSGRRGGTAYAHVMTMVAEGLQPAHIEAVAAYYQSLEQR